MNKKKLIMVAVLVVTGVLSMWARYASEQAEKRKREALFRSLSLHTSRPAPPAEVKPEEPADPRDVFDEGLMRESFDLVKQTVGQDFKLMELYVSELGFSANVSTDGQTVQRYLRPKGKKNFEGPGKVEIIGDGDIKDSLFDPAAANLALVPKLLEDAKERAALPEGRATSARFNYSFIRYKGESPEWTIMVETGRGDNWQHKFVTYDAKGKFKRAS